MSPYSPTLHRTKMFRWQTLLSLALPVVLTAAALNLAFGALTPVAASPAPNPLRSPLLPAGSAAVTPPGLGEARFFGPFTDVTYGVVSGDMNGDGALDIVVANFNQQSLVYFNDGQGNFYRGAVNCAQSPAGVSCFGGAEASQAVAVGDLNGDGMLDIVVANNNQQSLVYLNDGRGGFHYGAVDCAHLPGGVSCFGAPTAPTRSVAVADLNGDGRLDIVAGNNGAASAVYFGNGAGQFSLAQTFGSGTDLTEGVALGDMNGDGAPDIVVGNYDAPSRVYLNNGAGGFVATRDFASPTDHIWTVAVGDFNNDGALDIVAGHNGDSQLSAVYFNDGAGNFSSGQTFGAGDSTQSVAVGDVNGDGALDIVTGNLGQQDGVYLNDGAGHFGVPLAFDTGTNATRSVAAADLNGDGTLDLLVGNDSQPNAVYLNDGGGDFPASTAYQRPFGGLWTDAIAVGDLNSDGALDIVAGNSSTGQWNAVHLNDGAGNFPTARSFGTGTDNTQGLVVADMNGDGALDVVAANYGHQSNVYLNNGQGVLTPHIFGGSSDPTRSVAVGDVNGDGALDIVTGYNGRPSMIYLNVGAGAFSAGTALDAQTDSNRSMALGDFNGDGALDIVAGNEGQLNRVYLNDGAGRFAFAQSLGLQTNSTFAIAVGDVNGDGAPDVVTGNMGQPNVVYLNDGTGRFPAEDAYLRYFGTGTDNTYSVALGDLNGDGWPDIVVGNSGQAVAYLNDSAGNFSRARNFGAVGNTTDSVAVGDMNGDGALDIVAGNYDATPQNKVYLNGLTGGVGSASHLPRVALTWLKPLANANFAYGNPALRVMTTPITYTLLDLAGRPANVQAYYSLDGGGQWQPAVAAAGTSTRNLATANAATQTPSVLPNRVISAMGTTTSSLPITATGVISDISVWVNLTHSAPQQLVITLTAPSNQSVKLIDRRGAGGSFGVVAFDDQAATSIAAAPAPLNGSYRPEQFLSRLNGWAATGNWLLAVNSLTTTTGLLNSWGITVTLNTGVLYTYVWDLEGSGVFGQSDNVVFRVEANSTFTPTAWGVAGPYQQPYASAQTFPFRVRGTQVRVLKEDASPMPDALVYRLPAGNTAGGALLTDRTGQPFHTDGLGYLQGRGQLDPDDQLLALAPISTTSTYVLYNTSGAPTATGVSGYSVAPGGLQNLTVSANHPLVLFNLNVSLEWDAHTDATYLEQLSFNLQRASEYLYNFTNGQVALGKVTVYQNADEWAYSHVVIATNNRLRPFAIQGGLVETPTVDPGHATPSDMIIYSPGQVTMGATWNRYGNPGQTLGDDWSLILAHELSHYLLYQEDTYLGLDANGRLISESRCEGSAMGDLYDKPDNFNFIADAGYWNTHCQATLAARTLGRTEWATLKLWYPPLVSPTVPFTGPTGMPFDFTAVTIEAPLTPTEALADPTFYIDYADGQVSSSEARAYLLRSDRYMVNLGSPYGGQNRVLARGAQPGDRLCVFDRGLAQFGCRQVAAEANRLQMKQDAAWNPVIQFTPVNSRTLTLQVSGLPEGLVLAARIYPDLGPGETPIGLTRLAGSSAYTGTLTLTDPAMAGHIQVWVEEPATENNPRREAIVPYSIVGNLDQNRPGEVLSRLGGGLARGGIGRARYSHGPTRPGGAPAISPDGQMIFYTPNPVDFAPGTFFAIQAMAGLPTLPPGRTLVGQGYSLVASKGVTLPVGSVSVQYLSNEVLVAGADESDLTLYYYSGSAWVALDTLRDAYNNLVSAPSQGAGIYALMASKQIVLYSTGWNLMPYLIQTARPVSEALASISGAYNVIYAYAPTDTADPWKAYAPQVPSWVNDLDTLAYGTVYWINVTKPITAYFSTGPSVQTSLPMPPATIYGTLTDVPGVTPAEDMLITAWVNGNLCGQTRTRRVNEAIVYAVNVFASDGVTPGCGAAGQKVTLQIEGLVLPGSAVWNDDRVQAFSPGSTVNTFLPLVIR